MDYLEHAFLDARSPYDYTFNFWNDYLGLSTLVSSTRSHGPPFGPNSITESLKATLGLEDESDPECPCVMTHGVADGNATHLDSYERQHHHHHHHLHHLHQQHLPGERDSGLAGLELLSLERRRKPSPGGGGGSRGKPEPKVCVFCRNNGAPEEVYGTHILKTADGRVLCPILRAYTCPLCSANGDHAHTIKYCPLSREQPGAGAGAGAGAPGHRPSSRAARGGGGGGGTGKRLRVY